MSIRERNDEVKQKDKIIVKPVISRQSGPATERERILSFDSTTNRIAQLDLVTEVSENQKPR